MWKQNWGNVVMRRCIGFAILVSLSACGGSGSANEITLYRNSSLDRTIRVHFATFDGDSAAEPNRKNCEMAARLLNANINSLANGTATGVGFWCEDGRYSESGSVPAGFSAAFPTDTQ